MRAYCENRVKARGLCDKHYKLINRQVRMRLVSWQALVEAGFCKAK
jgi:hypothetical protein